MTLHLTPLTMDAAASFWQDKILLGPGKFSQLSDEAKIRAFGISGIAKGAELTTVFNALQAAIEKGISFSEFKKECAAIFERRGWIGKRDWRVQNIFRTNIQTAYNSGRWQSQKEKAGTFPYLQYNAVNDRRTRPTHKAMDGKVFPIDHPFWDTWYPPNGFRCRCSTISLTQKQVERMGLNVETEDPTNTPVAIPNPVTGEKLHVQQLLPDPGFNHHPGKVVWGGVGEPGGSPKTFTAMDDLAEPSDYQRPLLSKVKQAGLPKMKEGSLLPAGLSPEDYRAEFVKRFGQETVLRDAIGEPVIMTFAGIDQDLGPMIPLLEQLITQPFEIWLTPEQDESGRIRLTKRYLGLWRDDQIRAAMLVVSEAAPQGATHVLSPDDLDQMETLRRGLLLHPGRKK